MCRPLMLVPIPDTTLDFDAGDPRWQSAIRRCFLPCLLALSTLLIAARVDAADKPKTKAASADPGPKTAELYTTTNVWTFHLQFAADQWEAIERNTTVDFSRLSRGGPP